MPVACHLVTTSTSQSGMQGLAKIPEALTWGENVQGLILGPLYNIKFKQQMVLLRHLTGSKSIFVQAQHMD